MVSGGGRGGRPGAGRGGRGGRGGGRGGGPAAGPGARAPPGEGGGVGAGAVSSCSSCAGSEATSWSWAWTAVAVPSTVPRTSAPTAAERTFIGRPSPALRRPADRQDGDAPRRGAAPGGTGRRPAAAGSGRQVESRQPRWTAGGPRPGGTARRVCRGRAARTARLGTRPGAAHGGRDAPEEAPGHLPRQRARLGEQQLTAVQEHGGQRGSREVGRPHPLPAVGQVRVGGHRGGRGGVVPVPRPADVEGQRAEHEQGVEDDLSGQGGEREPGG